MRELRAGPLRVRAVGPESGPTVVLCHGYGASGDDLVHLASAVATPGVRYLFPEGPLSIVTGWIEGRAWWPVDMMRLQLELASGRARSWDEDAVPEGMLEARSALAACLSALDLDWSRTILGGFSQGAMITTELVLGDRLPVAGLAILSGSLVNRPRWVEGMNSLGPSLRVLQSHGTADPILPFGVAERLHRALVEAGAQAQFVRTPGGHEIRPVVVEALASFVTATLQLQR